LFALVEIVDFDIVFGSEGKGFVFLVEGFVFVLEFDSSDNRDLFGGCKRESVAGAME
jgi:hypothetical protein